MLLQIFEHFEYKKCVHLWKSTNQTTLIRLFQMQIPFIYRCLTVTWFQFVFTLIALTITLKTHIQQWFSFGVAYDRIVTVTLSWIIYYWHLRYIHLLWEWELLSVFFIVLYSVHRVRVSILSSIIPNPHALYLVHLCTRGRFSFRLFVCLFWPFRDTSSVQKLCAITEKKNYHLFHLPYFGISFVNSVQVWWAD